VLRESERLGTAGVYELSGYVVKSTTVYV